MALKAVVGSLDGLDENVRGLYRPGTKDEGLDGKFILDVVGEGGFALENVDGLRTALSTERGTLQRLKNDVKAFEGLDPSDVRTKLSQLEALLKDGDPDAKAQARIDQLVRQHEQAIAAAEAKAEKAMGSLRTRTIDAAVSSALAQADALNTEALSLKLKSHIRLRDTGNENDPFAIEVVDAAGNPIIDSKGQSLDVSGFVSSLRNDQAWATAFKPAGKAGSGAEGSTGPAGKTITRQAFQSLDPAAQMAQIKAGMTVVD